MIGKQDITDIQKYTLQDEEASVTVILTGRGNFESTEVQIKDCYRIRKASTAKVYKSFYFDNQKVGTAMIFIKALSVTAGEKAYERQKIWRAYRKINLKFIIILD